MLTFGEKAGVTFHSSFLWVTVTLMSHVMRRCLQCAWISFN